MTEDRQKPGGVPWAPLILLVLLGAAALPFGIARFRQERRFSNERSASTALKTMSTAEADFRANDRDGNGVNDFWTGDVAGLGRLGLIQPEVAQADAAPLVPATPKPFAGYYFAALQFDGSATPPELLRQDTDKKSGKVHHLGKFGFVAYPAEPGISGHHIFIINENNSVWSIPAMGNTVPKNWPTDSEAAHWNRCSGG